MKIKLLRPSLKSTEITNCYNNNTNINQKKGNHVNNRIICHLTCQSDCPFFLPRQKSYYLYQFCERGALYQTIKEYNQTGYQSLSIVPLLPSKAKFSILQDLLSACFWQKGPSSRNESFYKGYQLHQKTTLPF